MDMKLSKGFCEMSNEETLNTEGGGVGTIIAIGALALGLMCVTKGCADADAGK